MRTDRVVSRVSRAFVFGGLFGATYGTAACPDHFTMGGLFRYIGVWAVIGMLAWGSGSLLVGGSPADEY